MSNPIARWETLLDQQKPTAVLRKAVWYVAYNLSALVNQTISATSYELKVVPRCDLAAPFKDGADKIVATYLLLSEDLPGQAILMLSQPAAYAAIDLMLDAQPGTTTHLGALQRSALGELGNVAISSFLNVVAQPGWGPLHPSPPAVMVEQLDIVLDLVATSIATRHESLAIIEARFHDPAKTCLMRLWIIPNPDDDIRAPTHNTPARKLL